MVACVEAVAKAAARMTDQEAGPEENSLDVSLVALIVLVVWIAIFAIYFVTMRGQKDIQAEIDVVQQLLGEDQGGGRS